MADGGAAFGFSGADDDDDDDDIRAMFVDEQAGDIDEEAAPVTSAEELAPDLQAGEVDDEVDEEPAPVEGEETETALDAEETDQEESPEEEQARLYAGRYQDIDQLERGYQQLQGAFTQAIESNKKLELRQAQQEALQAQIMEYIQAKAAEEDPELAAKWAQQQEIDAAIAAKVEERVAPIEQESQAQRYRAEVDYSARQFYDSHPDVPPGTPAEAAVTQAFRAINNALQPTGTALDPRNPDHLAVAYEALQHPEMGEEIVANPTVLRNPVGLSRLRSRFADGSGEEAPSAGSPDGGTQPQKQRGPVRRRVEAFVETGGNGAPTDTAPGEQPKDEFDEAMEFWAKKHTRGALFGAAR